VEIPEAPICCGSAGIYNLVQPNAANALGDRKAGLIASLDADVVVTGNPGCICNCKLAGARREKNSRAAHDSASRRLDSRAVDERPAPPHVADLALRILERKRLLFPGGINLERISLL